MGSYRWKALPLALTALFAALSFYPALCPSRGVLFLFFFGYLVLVPGALLARRFAPGARGAVLALASFVLGTAAVFAALFVLALFRLDIALIRIIVPAAVVALAVAKRREAEPEHARTGRRDGRVGAPALGVLVLIAIVSALVLRTEDPKS